LRALLPVLAGLRPSRLHLPASLRSRPITGPSSLLWTLCLLRAQLFSALPRRRGLAPARAGLPDSCTRPSDHSVSNHLRMLRLVRARYPSTGRTEIASPRVFSQRELGASPLASRLASPHRPNRVSYRTDWPFTSCCSPPRVTTTQLQAITSYVDLERTFTPPTRCALRRTSAGVSPAVAWASCPRAGRVRVRSQDSGGVHRTPEIGDAGATNVPIFAT
jgi:hypothetical protein